MSNHDQYSLRIALADSDADILACLPVLRQWRPEIGREGDFAARVRHLQERGYRLMAVWQGDRVVACAGYGLAENLIRGRYLHINELVTAWSVRSTGIGQRLLQALIHLEGRATSIVKPYCWNAVCEIPARTSSISAKDCASPRSASQSISTTSPVVYSLIADK